MMEEFLQRLKRMGINAEVIKLGELQPHGCGNPTCPKCAGQIKEIATLTPEDEVRLAELRSRAQLADKVHEEAHSKIRGDFDRMMADWKDKYQLHGYSEFGLDGNKLKGIPR